MDQTSTFTSAHLDALKLEIDLLDKILVRNRCSHGKAKYYRLLDMACTFLRKSNVLGLYDDMNGLLKEIPEMCRKFKLKRKREEIFWDFQCPKEELGTAENEFYQVSKRLDRVANCAACQLPVCLSKLVYASKFFFLEISRGFFLPFCVVTIGAIARTRTLLEQLGRYVLEGCWDELERHWTVLRDLNGETTTLPANTTYKDDIQKALSSFVLSHESTNYDTTLSKVDRAAAIMRDLGVRITLSNKSKTKEARKDSRLVEPSDVHGSPNHDQVGSHYDCGEILSSNASAHTKQGAYHGKDDSRSFYDSDSRQIDRNAEIVEQIKGKKKTKEKRPVPDAMNVSKSKKKRKEKVGKKGNGDFFDNLFAR